MTCIDCETIVIQKCAPYANRLDTVNAIKDVCRKTNCSFEITNTETVLTIEAYLLATYPAEYPNDCCQITWAYNPNGDLFYKDLGSLTWHNLLIDNSIYELPSNTILTTAIDAYLLSIPTVNYPPVNAQPAWAYTPNGRLFSWTKYPGNPSGLWRELTNQAPIVFALEVTNLTTSTISAYLALNSVSGNPTWPLSAETLAFNPLVYARTTVTGGTGGGGQYYFYDRVTSTWVEISRQNSITYLIPDAVSTPNDIHTYLLSIFTVDYPPTRTNKPLFAYHEFTNRLFAWTRLAGDPNGTWLEITSNIDSQFFAPGDTSDTFDAAWFPALPSTDQKLILFAGINDSNVDYTDKNQQLFFKANGISEWINLTTNIVNVSADNLNIETFERTFSADTPDVLWPKTQLQGAEESLRFLTKNGRAYARAVTMDSAGGTGALATWSRISPNEKLTAFYKLINNQSISTINEFYSLFDGNIELDETEGNGVGVSERVPLIDTINKYFTLIQGLDSHGQTGSLIRFNRKGLYRFTGQFQISGDANINSSYFIELRIVKRKLLMSTSEPVGVYAKQTFIFKHETALQDYLVNDSSGELNYNPTFMITSDFYHSDISDASYGYGLEFRIINYNLPATSANENIIGGFNALDGTYNNSGVYYCSPSSMKITLLAEDIDELE